MERLFLMFALWIPLRHVGLGCWVAYTVMCALNLGSNIYSHRRGGLDHLLSSAGGA
jgi:hypothetical protein